MGNSSRDYSFYVRLKNISKRKSDANEHNYERKLNLTREVRVNASQNNRDFKQNLLNFLVQM